MNYSDGRIYQWFESLFILNVVLYTYISACQLLFCFVSFNADINFLSLRMFSLVLIAIEIERIHRVTNEHNRTMLHKIFVIHSKFALRKILFLHGRTTLIASCVCAISKRRYSLIYTAALVSSFGPDRRRM
jgi:hypothetical protein